VSDLSKTVETEGESTTCRNVKDTSSGVHGKDNLPCTNERKKKKKPPCAELRLSESGNRHQGHPRREERAGGFPRKIGGKK